MKTQKYLFYVSFAINILNFSERFGLLELIRKMTARTFIDILILLSLLVTGFFYIRSKVVEIRGKYKSNLNAVDMKLGKRIDDLRENINGHYSGHNIPIDELRREIEEIKKSESTGKALSNYKPK